MLTALDKIFTREGLDPKTITLLVTKTLSQSPKMIEAITLQIFYPDKLSDILLKKIRAAINTCPVKRSLNEQIQIDIAFKTGEKFR